MDLLVSLFCVWFGAALVLCGAPLWAALYGVVLVVVGVSVLVC